VARKAAEIIQDRGKATGVLEDDRSGQLCAMGALWAAQRSFGFYSGLCVGRVSGRASRLVNWYTLPRWNDLPTTTEQDIAKLFLQVADNLEIEDQ
jgi:hypothetical protein